MLRAFAEAKQRCVQSVRRGQATAYFYGSSTPSPVEGLTEAVPKRADSPAAPIWLFAIYVSNISALQRVRDEEVLELSGCRS